MNSRKHSVSSNTRGNAKTNFDSDSRHAIGRNTAAGLAHLRQFGHSSASSHGLGAGHSDGPGHSTTIVHRPAAGQSAGIGHSSKFDTLPSSENLSNAGHSTGDVRQSTGGGQLTGSLLSSIASNLAGLGGNPFSAFGIGQQSGLGIGQFSGLGASNFAGLGGSSLSGLSVGAGHFSGGQKGGVSDGHQTISSSSSLSGDNKNTVHKPKSIGFRQHAELLASLGYGELSDFDPEGGGESDHSKLTGFDSSSLEDGVGHSVIEGEIEDIESLGKVISTKTFKNEVGGGFIKHTIIDGGFIDEEPESIIEDFSQVGHDKASSHGSESLNDNFSSSGIENNIANERIRGSKFLSHELNRHTGRFKNVHETDANTFGANRGVSGGKVGTTRFRQSQGLTGDKLANTRFGGRHRLSGNKFGNTGFRGNVGSFGSNLGATRFGGNVGKSGSKLGNPRFGGHIGFTRSHFGSTKFGGSQGPSGSNIGTSRFKGSQNFPDFSSSGTKNEGSTDASSGEFGKFSTSAFGAGHKFTAANIRGLSHSTKFGLSDGKQSGSRFKEGHNTSGDNLKSNAPDNNRGLIKSNFKFGNTRFGNDRRFGGHKFSSSSTFHRGNRYRGGRFRGKLGSSFSHVQLGGKGFRIGHDHSGQVGAKGFSVGGISDGHHLHNTKFGHGISTNKHISKPLRGSHRYLGGKHLRSRVKDGGIHRNKRPDKFRNGRISSSFFSDEVNTENHVNLHQSNDNEDNTDHRLSGLAQSLGIETVSDHDSKTIPTIVRGTGIRLLSSKSHGYGDFQESTEIGRYENLGNRFSGDKSWEFSGRETIFDGDNFDPFDRNLSHDIGGNTFGGFGSNFDHASSRHFDDTGFKGFSRVFRSGKLSDFNTDYENSSSRTDKFSSINTKPELRPSSKNKRAHESGRSLLVNHSPDNPYGSKDHT